MLHQHGGIGVALLRPSSVAVRGTRQIHIVPVLAALAIGFVSSSTAHAAPLYSASLGEATATGVPCIGAGSAATNSPIPVGFGGSCTDEDGSSTSAASASTGKVGVRGSSISSSGVSLPEKGGGDASYSETVTFSSSDPLATSATVTMNYVFSGEISTTTDSSSVQVRASVSLNGGGEGLQLNATNGLDPTCTEIIAAPTGLCGGFTALPPGPFSQNLTTYPVLVPLNVPVPVLFTLSVETGAFYTGAAIADFSHTLGFPTGTDVFNLPAGFTANSETGDIINNSFRSSSGKIPEPATLALFGSGLAGLGALRRRKARKSI